MIIILCPVCLCRFCVYLEFHKDEFCVSYRFLKYVDYEVSSGHLQKKIVDDQEVLYNQNGKFYEIEKWTIYVVDNMRSRRDDIESGRDDKGNGKNLEMDEKLAIEFQY